MYKQIGFAFDNLSEGDQSSLIYSVGALLDYYQKNDMTTLFSPPSGKRSTHRVKLANPLPRDLAPIEIWIWFNGRFRKCLIKDISSTGAGIILPFNDTNDIFRKDRPFTVLVEFPTTMHTSCVFKSFFCQSIVRYDRNFSPPQKLIDGLSQLNFTLHPQDKEKIRLMNKNKRMK